MKVAVVNQGVLTLDEVAEPTPGPGQLVLRVVACGICGSDLKTAGYMPAGAVMGHEFVGHVVAAGPDVAAAWPLGTAAVGMPVMGCGACRDCDADDPARCSQVVALGVGGGPGAFAELVLVNAAETFAFPTDLPIELGALVEPLAVGLHAVNAAQLGAGDRVLVVGGGPVGMAVALWASDRGAREVVISDPSADRRALATEFGATTAVDPTSEEVGTDFDVVIECVGMVGMVDLCIAALRPRGRAVIAGVCMEADPFWPVVAVTKDVTVAFASYYTRGEFKEAADRLASGTLDPGPYVSRSISLTELPDVFGDLVGATAERKVLVRP